MESLFPEVAAADGRNAVAPYDGSGKYRCTSAGDCAEQMRILRWLEGRGRDGATFEEMSEALGISVFRLAAVVDWMEQKDGFVVGDFVDRQGIRTAVVRAAWLPEAEPQKAQNAQMGDSPLICTDGHLSQEFAEARP